MNSTWIFGYVKVVWIKKIHFKHEVGFDVGVLNEVKLIYSINLKLELK